MKKSIKQIENLELGNFKKVFGNKIIGGGPCTTMTIKEVVITVPKPKALEESLEDDVTNDGTDDCGPEQPGHY